MIRFQIDQPIIPGQPIKYVKYELAARRKSPTSLDIFYMQIALLWTQDAKINEWSSCRHIVHNPEENQNHTIAG